MKNRLVILFLFLVVAHAQTEVSGNISNNTILNLDASPYIITDDLYVMPNCTLTIEPGVIIKIDGLKSIVIKGSLKAIGTNENYITFTKNNNSNWNKIKFETTNDSSFFDYCNIEFGSDAIEIDGAYFSYSPKVIVNNSFIHSNDGTGIKTYYNYSGIHVRNTVISNNANGGISSNWCFNGVSIEHSIIADNVGAGFSGTTSAFSVKNNHISRNSIGIFFTGNQTSSVNQNNIVGNDVGMYNNYTNGTNNTTVDFNNFDNLNYNFENGSSSSFTFENNWWGSTNDDTINTSIFDVYENLDLGVVDYVPFLITPNTDAPPIPAQNVTLTGSGDDFVSLSWDASELGDLAGYKVYYDTDESGYPYENSIDVGNVTSHTLSDLALGTTYHIAVTTYDTDGNESWFSNEVSGVTRVLEVQNLTIGVNEDRMHIIDHAPMISFDYYDSMGEEQTSYQIQVSADSLFITPGDIWESGIVSSDTTNVQYAGNELIDGNKYFLRVRAASGDFWSNWSYLSFRMNSKPTIPILVSPINNQVTTTPTILSILNSVDAEDENITYSFNVFEDAAMEIRLDSVIGIPPGQDTTKWQIGFSLPDNGQYFWNVTANDGFENSNLSEIGSFLLNTDNNPPDLFSLLIPMVNTSVQTLSPVFSWQVANDPDPVDTIRYRLLLDTPAPGVEVYEIGTDTSFVIPDQLLDNTQYFWQVIASDLLGFQTSNDGGYQTFFVNISNDPPTLSTLIAPLQGSIQTDIRPNFYWSEAHDPDPFDHVSYSIEWWPVNETDVMFIEDIDTNTFSPEYDLSDNAKFGWRVTAKDIEGLSSMTDSSYFFTDAFPEPPLAFSTVYPENNTEGLATSIDFAWNKTTDPDPLDEVTYQLVYGTDWQDSSTYVFSDIITDTSISVLLDDNIQYYWIVIARDADGFIVGSNNDTPNMVTVGTLSLDNNTVPTVFALHQNYPNPFNPTTQIRYDLPEDQFVSISIYDVMGRKIRSLMNTSQTAGYHTIRWDARNDMGEGISAGVYFYSIEARDFRQTKKMILLK